MPEQFLYNVGRFLEETHLLEGFSGLRPYFTKQVLVIGLVVFGTAALLALLSGLTVRHRPLLPFRWALLLIYLYGNMYFTLLNRSVDSYYRIQDEAFFAYRHSMVFDYGPLYTLQQLLHADWSGGLSTVHIISTEPLEGIFLNILLYIPLGYLLPYAFGWFSRGLLLWKTILAGFLLSCATEAIQLHYHMGCYDLDDIMNNTLGTAIGALLYGLLVWFFDYRKRHIKRPRTV